MPLPFRAVIFLLPRGSLSWQRTSRKWQVCSAHEISHVTERHVAQMIEKSKRLNIATLAAMLAGALRGGGAGRQRLLAMAPGRIAGALLEIYP